MSSDGMLPRRSMRRSRSKCAGSVHVRYIGMPSALTGVVKQTRFLSGPPDVSAVCAAYNSANSPPRQ